MDSVTEQMRSGARPPQPPPRNVSTTPISPTQTPSKFYISSSMDTSYAVTPDTTATGPAPVEEQEVDGLVAAPTPMSGDNEQSFTRTATYSGQGSTSWMTTSHNNSMEGSREGKLHTRATQSLVDALQSTSFTSSSSLSSSRIPLVSSVVKRPAGKTISSAPMQMMDGGAVGRARGQRVRFLGEEGEHASASTSLGPLNHSSSLGSSSALMGASEVNEEGAMDDMTCAAVLHSFLQARACAATSTGTTTEKPLEPSNEEKGGRGRDSLEGDTSGMVDIDADMAKKLLYVLQNKDEVIRDLTHSLLESHAEADKFQEAVVRLQGELKQASNGKETEKRKEESINGAGESSRKISDAIVIERLRQENQGHVECLASKERQLERLQLRVNQLQLEGEHREEVINTLQQEMNDALLKWEAVVRELRDAEHHVATQKLQIEQLERERDEKQTFWLKEKENWRAEEKKLRSALQASESRHQAEWSALQLEITQLSEDVNEVNATRQEQLQQSKSVQEQLADKSFQCTSLEQQLAEVQHRRVQEAALFEEARLLDKQEKLKLQAILEQRVTEQQQCFLQNQQLQQAQRVLDEEIKTLTDTLEVSTITIQQLQQQLRLKEEEQEQMKNTALERFETLLREEEEQQKSVLSQVEFCVQNGEEMNKIVASAEYKRKKAEDKLQKVMAWNEKLQLSAQEQAAKMAEDILEQHQWAAEALGKLHEKLQEMTARLHEATTQNTDLHTTVHILTEMQEAQKVKQAELEKSVLHCKEELKQALCENLALTEERQVFEKAEAGWKKKETVMLRQLQRWQSILWSVVRELSEAGGLRQRSQVIRVEAPCRDFRDSGSTDEDDDEDLHTSTEEWVEDEPDQDRTTPISSCPVTGKKDPPKSAQSSSAQKSTGCATCRNQTPDTSATRLNAHRVVKMSKFASSTNVSASPGRAAEPSVCHQGLRGSSQLRSLLKRIGILVYQLHEKTPSLKKWFEGYQLQVQQLKQQQKRARVMSHQREEQHRNEMTKLRNEMTAIQETLKKQQQQERNHAATAEHLATLEMARREALMSHWLDVVRNIPQYLVGVLGDIIRVIESHQHSAVVSRQVLPTRGDPNKPAPHAVHSRGKCCAATERAVDSGVGISPEWTASASITKECDDLVKEMLGLEGGWQALAAAASAQSNYRAEDTVEAASPDEPSSAWGEQTDSNELCFPLSYLSDHVVPSIAKFEWSAQQMCELSAFIQSATLRMESQVKSSVKREELRQKKKITALHEREEVDSSPHLVPAFLKPLLNNPALSNVFSSSGQPQERCRTLSVQYLERASCSTNVPLSSMSEEMSILLLRCALHVLACATKEKDHEHP